MSYYEVSFRQAPAYLYLGYPLDMYNPGIYSLSKCNLEDGTKGGSLIMWSHSDKPQPTYAYPLGTTWYHYVLLLLGVDILLAPQSGALRISAYRDFQSHPIPSQSTYSFRAFKPLYSVLKQPKQTKDEVKWLASIAHLPAWAPKGREGRSQEARRAFS